MTFSSGVFLFYFLPLFLLVYAVVPQRHRLMVISLASYVYCAWWRPGFVLPLAIVTIIGFVGGVVIDRERSHGRKGEGCLLATLIALLGLLTYFKYSVFAVDILNAVLRRTGAPPIRIADIILPVGLSFYTFKTVSYIIDVYRGASPPAANLLAFATYVAMFPQLVAGPIGRYKATSDELRSRNHSVELFYRGVLFFQIGLAGKVLVADTLGSVADQAFDSGVGGLADAWIGALAYTFQLFFDFAGYSDMAIGLGLMMGFHFPVNFNCPYRAVSVTDFWQRWHITLSTWLRDYLFLPVAYLGSRRVRDFRLFGFSQDYYVYALAALVTMSLAGLWHGAGWSFVAWGTYHGLWLVIDRFLTRKRLCRHTPRPLRVFATFLIILFGWILFRSGTLRDAGAYLRTMLALGSDPLAPLALEIRPIHLLIGALAAAWAWLAPPAHDLVPTAGPAAVFLLQLVFIISILHLHFHEHVPFLYFRF
ncbi:MBOAT family protein [Candidatus Fermentibacteria bacterium]|nr:MBOAT family protein [Candidatus Fermentibacteria bacterium]